jgi:glutamate N-acetyltransferase / amino-acid N-acetyltransferase
MSTSVVGSPGFANIGPAMTDDLTIDGFRFSAVSANIRKDGRIDLALAAADRPCVVAARYTLNFVRAAPVTVSANRTAGRTAQAVLANSGCANACTGYAGLSAAQVATGAVARELGLSSSLVLPASTGVIGQLLPSEKVVARAPELVQGLRSDGARDFAQAICTTDKFVKIAQANVGTAGKLLGIAKGAGMIQPNVGRLIPTGDEAMHATMLVFMFTDVQADFDTLDKALQAGVDASFNSISVDGDTSTNDTVLALASGASGKAGSLFELTDAMTQVCNSLAEDMVRDGEGTSHVAELWVRGLSTNDAAKSIARTIGNSLLVKTAMCGQDANWGRWLAAAGRAGVPFNPSEAEIRIDGIAIVKSGQAVGDEAEKEAKVRMQLPRYVVELQLGKGPGQARFLMCDLTHEYVNVNADYRS